MDSNRDLLPPSPRTFFPVGQLTGTPTCAQHPDAEATACSRCGTFACDACLVGDLRNRPVCADCEIRLSTAAATKLKASMRAVTIAGLFFASLALFASFRISGERLGMWLMIAWLLAYLSVAASFVVWFRRTSSALRARGARLEFGPNAWGWFVVPVMNLFRPYQAVQELHDAATGHPHSVLLKVWWAGWVFQMVVVRMMPKEWPLKVPIELGVPAIIAVLLAVITRRITQSMLAPRPAGLRKTVIK